MSKQNQTQDSNEYGKYGLPNECGCVQTLTIRTEIYKVEQIDQNPVKKKSTFNCHCNTDDMEKIIKYLC